MNHDDRCHPNDNRRAPSRDYKAPKDWHRMSYRIRQYLCPTLLRHILIRIFLVKFRFNSM